MDKPIIIQQLQKELKTEFEKVDISEIMEYSQIEKFAKYSISQYGNISGLRINGFAFKQFFETIKEEDILYLQLHLIYLNLHRNEISSLYPISEFANLKEIDLSGNKIWNISSIKNLRSLIFLNLSYNLTFTNSGYYGISDISSIKELKKIKAINFSGNSISDISVINELKMLNYASFRDNIIKKLPKFNNLINLKSLYLHKNPIEDFTSLKELTSLDKPVIIYELEKKLKTEFKKVGISSIIDWKSDGDPQYATTENNIITGIRINHHSRKEGLINFFNNTELAKKITHLNLARNGIISLSVFKKYDQLKHLVVNNNKISDISNIENLIEKSDFICDLKKNPLSNKSLKISHKHKNIIIKKLEKQLSSFFKQIQFEKVCISEMLEFQMSKTIKYSEDKNGNIIGLCIVGFNVKEISNILDYLQTKAIYLTHLNLSSNSISNISALEKFKNLTYINLSSNNIIDFSVLKKMTNLTVLELYTNNISDISFIEQLKKIFYLDLSGNKISNISALNWIKKIETLNLSSNDISDITALKNMSDLHNLNLMHNSISCLAGIEELTNLTKLTLTGNKIRDISALKSLTNLVELYLSLNEIRNISALKRMVNLQELWAFENKISDISSLANLTNLNNLYLQKNKISDIHALKNLVKLRSVDLCENEISDISSLLNLTDLYSLDLSKNKIINLPEWIFSFSEMKISWKSKFILDLRADTSVGINLYGNPIKKQPKEIIKQGEKAIQDWFNSPKIENNEIKLILTGNTTVGKTTLVNFLTKEEYTGNNNSTHGIQITQWKKGNLNINIWDFGGQEYYHATHRLFLTTNSVYLLLWEESTNKAGIIPTKIRINNKIETIYLQHYDYSHWLGLIRKYTGFSENTSPILMVKNKIDKKGNEEERTDSKAMEKYAVKKDYYISIKEAYNQKDTSKDYDLDFRVFKNKLLEILQKTAKGQAIQVYIAKIREKIRKNRNEDIWNWKQYKDFCYKEANTEMTDERMKILTQYLHDTGVILYYGYDKQLQGNSKLKNSVFINPDYVTQTIYNILDYTVQENKGKFTKQHVIDKLHNKEKPEVFIALMQAPNFELIFKYPDEPNTYYATQYLPEKIEDKQGFLNEILNKFELSFVIKFNDFFSLSIMSRFIARFGFYSDEKWFAKTEILLIRNDLKVFVKCNLEKKQISVKTEIGNTKHNLIKSIFNTFLEISENPKNIEISTDNDEFYYIRDIKKYSISKYDFLIKLKMNETESAILTALIQSCETILIHKKNKRLLISNFKKGEKRENARNNAIATDLRLCEGYYIQEEFQIGESETKKTVGKVDIAIIQNYKIITLIEGLNHGVKNDFIRHLNKLSINYNPLKLKFAFLLTYYEKNDFSSGWKEYKNWIRDNENLEETDYDFQSDIKQTQGIKIASSKYILDGELNTKIYHVFINISG